MKRRIALAAFTALTLVGASWELNPLVTRRAQPAGPAPLGCDESLAPSAAPRVDVAQIPEREVILPASMPAPPPSRSLREELDAAHRALVRNDRPAFDEHLRASRSIVQTYPAGGERSRAEEVVWALNDAAVLWDAQFQSPFFDETSDAYARASRYAGYTDAVRRSVLTDDRDRRFYPAAESRDFVTRVAAERLQRLGVRGASAPPPRMTRNERPSAPDRVVTSSPSAPSPRRTTTSRPPSPSRRSSRSTAVASKSSKPAAPANSAPSSSPDPSDAPISPAPAEPEPTAPPASASQASADAPASPVAGEDQPVPEAAPEPVPDTATVTSAPDASAEPAPAAVPAERRSVIVPALLILIGLGVLVVLFRASK